MHNSSHYNNSNLSRTCQACGETLPIEEFPRQAHNQGFSANCKKCVTEGKLRQYKRSTLFKSVSRQLVTSHKRMLNKALEQKKEVTDVSKLRDMHPEMTDHQISRMARLNEKINAANDFLIEEQYYYLNPSERPSEGIEYRSDLFDNNDYEVDKEELQIINDQKDI